MASTGVPDRDAITDKAGLWTATAQCNLFPLTGSINLKMYTTQEYEIGRDTIEEGTPLEDLLELPEYNPETASDVFLIFLRELQEQEEG
jgi:hypothetical protein